MNNINMILDKNKEYLKKIKILDHYQHYKGGIYAIGGHAIHTETEEVLVIYYNIDDPSHLWARPASMFFEEIMVDGKAIPRFKYIKNVKEKVK